ncbi:hypothetical protein F4861DRAFT_371163 [Xylaria intraflava]|nr:hypothetical protein F4861DRAFT_371163 [Xylaria intraflava]
MSYSPHIFMSGAFHFDPPNGGSGRGTSFSGVHPGIFQPPASPSVSSSMFLGKSTTSLQSDAHQPIHNAKRKRTTQKESTPFSDWGAAADGAYNADNIIADRSDFDLRTSGHERQYVLGGRMEAPNGVTGKEFGYIEDSVYSDVDYRRALGPKRSHDGFNSPTSTSVTAEPADQRPTGWGSYAISTIGDVVGKVWEFCKTGAFRGFYAGGGQGYEISEANRQPQTDVQSMHHHANVITPGRELSPPRGVFPQADYSPLPYEPESPESTPPPAAKRRQLWNGTPNDELQKNWVVIEQPANAIRQPFLASQAYSRRPAPRAASSLARRINKPVSRLSTPSFNRHPPRPTPASAGPLPNRAPASFASTRSPDAPSIGQGPTPSRIPVPARPQTPSRFAASQFTPQPSQIPSPNPFSKRSHRRNQSVGSTPSIAPGKMAKRESLHEMHDNSPRLDAHARSLAAQRKQDEMEADIRINDFNARLRDMIRQGKEALGTTYEIELCDDGTKEDLWESDNDELC